MNVKEFRAELLKVMPGYKWTVTKPYRLYGEGNTEPGWALMQATGIQSAGFNRMSTLAVERRVEDKDAVTYEAKVAGYGMRGPWRATCERGTLAQALRGVQETCEEMRSEYAACVHAMQRGRDKEVPT